jgi:hypothetical protein
MDVIADGDKFVAMPARECVPLFCLHRVCDNIEPLHSHVLKRAPFFALDFAYGEAESYVHLPSLTPFFLSEASVLLTSPTESPSAFAISSVFI